MPVNRRALISLAAGVLLALSCAAQCAAPQWYEANAFPGVDGQVYAAKTFDLDGAGPAPAVLVIGGYFRLAGSVTTSRVAYWDGQAWQPLGNINTSSVSSLVVFNNELVAGGVLPTGVARWNGTAWVPLGTTGPGSGGATVYSLAVYNGQLYASGAAASNTLSRWDGVNWQTIPGSGVTGMWSLAVHGGNLVGIGGTASPTVSQIVSWNGTTWTNLGGQTNNRAWALAVHNGNLFTGGVFSMIGATPVNHVGQWNGSSWQTVGAGFPNFVSTLSTWNGNLVAASGPFGYVTPWTVAQWNGSTWQNLGAPNGQVSCLAGLGADLYGFGWFDNVSGTPANGAARFDGTSWSRIGNGVNHEIQTVVSHAGDLYAGGSFTFAGTQPAAGVARWDGAAWHPLGTGLSAVNGPYSIGALASWNGQLVAGGSFTVAGNTVAPIVAAWNGSSWSALGAGLTGTGAVKALAVYNGEIIAGGTFSQSYVVPVPYVARFDGLNWQPLGGGTNGEVAALAVYNGELYAGGGFSNAGGVPAANLARWNGSVWQPVGPGAAGYVGALAVHGGELFVGGSFASAGGQPAQNVARWNGAAWVPLPQVGCNGITAMASYGGELVAASGVWALSSGTTLGIARWNGASWDPMGGGLTVSGQGPPWQPWVKSLAVHRGSLFAAGSFTGTPSVGSPDLVRWASSLPLVSITQPAAGQVRINDAWLVPGHEYYNLASADLCSGGAGTGPWGGLCSNDPMALLQQINLPLGAVPFHFAATGTTASFGSYALQAGFAFEAISVDVTGGAICLSEAVRHVVQ